MNGTVRHFEHAVNLLITGVISDEAFDNPDFSIIRTVEFIVDALERVKMKTLERIEEESRDDS